MTAKGNVVGGAMVTPAGKLVPVIADRGAAGADSKVPGPAGWTPVLAGELDGTRTLIRVADWTGGEGTKPATGMYIGTTGYVSTKAAAFNFNATKRVVPLSAGPTVAGVVQISFASLGLATAPVVVPLPATTSILSGATSTTISNVTKDGCTATVRQAALLTAVVTLLAGATANVLIIET
jgi:hypothetical protein